MIHDPTTLNRQGNDAGTQYRSGIYFHTPEQAVQARAMLAELTQAKAWERPIVTEVLPLDNYSAAEDYHQDYAIKHPNNSYIVYNDAPKVENLKKVLPDVFRAEPVTVASAK